MARSMKNLVWFQGGGQLGSFGAGAWREISRWLNDRDESLVALGGASIGALNAALVVAHMGEEDRGAGALESIWREVLAGVLLGNQRALPAGLAGLDAVGRCKPLEPSDFQSGADAAIGCPYCTGFPHSVTRNRHCAGGEELAARKEELFADLGVETSV